MRTGLSPLYPFRVDTNDSDYYLVQTTPDLVRQNLKNLILTNPGERIMDPEFGVGISRFLFENRTTATTIAIKNRIISQAKRYMPFVTINDVQFSTNVENENYLGITIKYIISSLRTVDSLIINFNLSNNP